MKTLLQVKQAISDLMEMGKEICPYTEKSKRNKANKSLRFLRKVETYLESNPDAEYVKIELGKVKKRIKEIEERGPYDNKGLLIPRTKNTADDKKAIAAYDKNEGLAKLRDFRKFLNYINS